MKSWLRWPGLLLLVVVLAGCAQHSGTTVSINAGVGPPGEPPPPSQPAAVHRGPCPYLNDAFVEQVTQRPVASVRIGDHPPYPACFFYGQDGRSRLWVWVFLGPPSVADAVVHTYAPVGTSRPVTLNEWQGGYSPRRSGEVLAIGRSGVAIVVASEVRADSSRRVATKVIRTLRL